MILIMIYISPSLLMVHLWHSWCVILLLYPYIYHQDVRAKKHHPNERWCGSWREIISLVIAGGVLLTETISVRSLVQQQRPQNFARSRIVFFERPKDQQKSKCKHYRRTKRKGLEIIVPIQAMKELWPCCSRLSVFMHEFLC